MMEFILGAMLVFLYYIQKHMGEIADELKKLNSERDDKSNASQPQPDQG